MDKISSPIKRRIMEYLESKGISKQDFYLVTGISASNFKGQGLKSDLGGEKIAKILTIYNDIDPNWLLNGIESSNSEYLFQEDRAPYRKSEQGTPVYNHNAWAGSEILNFSNKEYIEEYIKVPFATKGDVAIHIQGNSMYPSMWPGDIAVLREVSHWRDWISFGKAYVISTNDQLLVKIVRKGKVNPEKYFNLYSVNMEYDDFEIPKDSIIKLMMVVGIVGNRDY